MATINASIPHEQRTAFEPRENSLVPMILSHIHQVNSSIRLLRLSAKDPSRTIKFLPGQWLDTFVPSLPRAGGFTITSTPASAIASPKNPTAPYLELAIQKSSNPPAKWLSQPAEDILGTQLAVRVGGSFTYPPPNLDVRRIERLVLVAGGVGINPLISIFKFLIEVHASQRPKEIHFLYATKAATPSLDPQEILFLTRLQDLVAAAAEPRDVTLSLYLTGALDSGDLGYAPGERIEDGRLPNRSFARRFGKEDLVGAVDGWKKGMGGGRDGTVVYVCGPQRMTDEVVDYLRGLEGMDESRVLCEKWW